MKSQKGTDLIKCIVLPALINFRLDILARVLDLDWLPQLPGAIGVMGRYEDAGALDTILGLDFRMIKLVIIFPNELVILVFTIWNKTKRK